MAQPFALLLKTYHFTPIYICTKVKINPELNLVLYASGWMLGI